MTLRYSGVPIDGPFCLFGDNGSVVTSSTIPESQLGKRQCALFYHYVLKAIASSMVLFYHIPGEIYPTDLLSKHWEHHMLWPQLKAIFVWIGDAVELFIEESKSEVGKQ